MKKYVLLNTNGTRLEMKALGMNLQHYNTPKLLLLGPGIFNVYTAHLVET